MELSEAAAKIAQAGYDMISAAEKIASALDSVTIHKTRPNPTHYITKEGGDWQTYVRMSGGEWFHVPWDYIYAIKFSDGTILDLKAGLWR